MHDHVEFTGVVGTTSFDADDSWSNTYLAVVFRSDNIWDQYIFRLGVSDL